MSSIYSFGGAIAFTLKAMPFVFASEYLSFNIVSINLFPVFILFGIDLSLSLTESIYSI